MLTFARNNKNNHFMKRILLLMSLMVAFLSNTQALFADDNASNETTDPTKQGVITTPPAGDERHYYLDLLNLDPYDGGMGYLSENHSELTMVYAANGEVYMKCPLATRTMPAWLKGQLSADGKTLTFKNGQTVFHAVNTNDDYIFVSADEEGKGGLNGESDALYEQDIVFNIDPATGVLTPETSPICPDVAIVSKTAVGTMYQQGRFVRIIPVANVDNNVQYFTLTCRDTDTNKKKEASVKVSLEDNGNTLYIKGLYPTYAQAWVKATKEKDGRYWVSTEVLGYDFSEYPYFTVCAEKNLDESFSLKQTFPLAFNAADGSYTFNDPVQTMAVGYVPEGESSVSVLQSYNNVKLTPATQSTLKPVTPKIYTGADGEMSCYTVSEKYDEFIFTADRKDLDGNVLNEDDLAFRIYVDGALYTFTTTDYPGLKAGKDLTDVPYKYHDYHYFYKSNTKRYIYFSKITGPKSTIGVELVHKVNGKEYVSDRLVYDIATDKDSVISGISTAESAQKAVSTEWYDLTGRRLPAATKGINLRLTRFADGSVKTVKVVK